MLRNGEAKQEETPGGEAMFVARDRSPIAHDEPAMGDAPDAMPFACGWAAAADRDAGRLLRHGDQDH